MSQSMQGHGCKTIILSRHLFLASDDGLCSLPSSSREGFKKAPFYSIVLNCERRISFMVR